MQVSLNKAADLDSSIKRVLSPSRTAAGERRLKTDRTLWAIYDELLSISMLNTRLLEELELLSSVTITEKVWWL